MSGLHRLSRRRGRKFQDSEFAFGIIALALLATLAIGLTLATSEGPSLNPLLLLGP
jgi:hypothetical protein